MKEHNEKVISIEEVRNQYDYIDEDEGKITFSKPWFDVCFIILMFAIFGLTIFEVIRLIIFLF